MRSAAAGRRFGLFYARPSIWAVLGLAVFDLVWNCRAGLTFTGWGRPISCLIGVSALTMFYSKVRRRPQLAEMCFYASAWVVFAPVAGISTYLAAALRFPLVDTMFRRADLALGFDWGDWTHAVQSRVIIDLILQLAYMSMLPQVIFSLIFFACVQVRARNEALLLNTVIALAATSLISGLLPALGPLHALGAAVARQDNAQYLRPMMELRGQTATVFSLATMQGIVTFPSFHAVMAVLFMHGHRDQRWTRWPILSINVAMLASTMSVGGHYLSDVVGGVLIATATIGATSLFKRIDRYADEQGAGEQRADRRPTSSE